MRRKLEKLLYYTSKHSLNKRLALIPIVVLVPMALLIGYVLYTLHASNYAFDKIAESVTYANRYAVEFSERMDYSMYLAVIRGQHVDELEAGKVTVNGVKIVNPYNYIREVQSACDEMSEIATVDSNKSLPMRIKKTLNSLEKRIREIDENMDVPGSYGQNQEMLQANVYNLTEIIESGIQDYVNVENANFAAVKTEVLRRSALAFQIAVVAMLLTVGLAIILSYLVSKTITLPIHKLSEMTRQVAKGDFTARTDVQSEDEIAVLTGRFNDMTEEIGVLVDGIKTEQANLRMMETKLLQAQINPHFLYNTLDTIVWLAEEKQTEDVVSMVSWLSEFFRSTLSKGRDYITVGEEKSHIESYLKIQHFRYQDILEYTISMDPEIYSFMIPKLTLQPLVENALYHGIKQKRGKGGICIHGYQKGKRLVFQVLDNGRGMSREVLDDLRRKIAGLESSTKGGFGLSNVNQRIQYYYGEEYGVFLESEENQGTEATIIIEAKKIPPLS